MLDKLKEAFNQARQYVQDHDSIRIGESWEKDVRDHFFLKEDYQLVKGTKSYKENEKDYELASLDPDFLFECRATKQRFYIECKARDITKFLKKLMPIEAEFEKLKNDRQALRALEQKHKYSDIYEICSEDQFIRYKKANASAKVLFMVLFFHDSRKVYPETVSLIPLDDMLTNKLQFTFYQDYIIPEMPVSPANLWRHFVLFYGKPANCIRCNTRIKFNNIQPFCYECWQQWFKYKKFTYQEKYCHSCGVEYPTSSIKPLCSTCFGKFPINFGL